MVVLGKLESPVWGINDWKEIYTYRDFYGQIIEVRWDNTFDHKEALMSNGPHGATNNIEYIYQKLRWDSMAVHPGMKAAEKILEKFSEWRKRMGI